ncbi:MAG: hypothetical protein H6Q12_310 [Bacteroidetes bacterium]|nr:hypothetical protein [Bacteroidota bacterium]
MKQKKTKLFYSMKKNNFHSRKIAISILLLFGGIISGCSDKEVELSQQETRNNTILTKSAYDNSFDWENCTKVDMVNGSGNIVKDVNLPWQLGVSNMGIPSEWIDQNIEEEYSQRMYTKQNNWELVYSNIRETTSYKYIVLYNKMTGVLRCFYYILSDPSSTGTTNSVWGIGINKSSALFNYTSCIAEDASIKKASPIYISTPIGAISNTTFSTVGFQNQVWYGIEIECAYDPQTSISDDCNLYLMGRAIDKITYNGTGTSNGNIEGTITSTAPAGAGLSLQFSNMFNTTNSIITNQNSVVGAVGDTVEKGVTKKDPFFTSLWNNIKSNAGKWAISGLESGVKQGLSAIVSSGGTAVAKIIGNLFSSISGSNNTISKVDMKMVLNSKYKFEGEKVLPGWTDCALPVPGTKSDTQANRPLYNNALGVWNLVRTPKIKLFVTNWQIVENGYQIFSDKSKTSAEYVCDETESILAVNPIIANDYIVTNFNCKIAQDPSCCNEPNYDIEPALINGVPYYIGSFISHTKGLDYNYANLHGGAKKGIVEVSFNLTSKTNSSVVYYYKKYFVSNVVIELNETKYVKENEMDNDPSIP